MDWDSIMAAIDKDAACDYHSSDKNGKSSLTVLVNWTDDRSHRGTMFTIDGHPMELFLSSPIGLIEDLDVDQILEAVEKASIPFGFRTSDGEWVLTTVIFPETSTEENTALTMRALMEYADRCEHLLHDGADKITSRNDVREAVLALFQCASCQASLGEGKFCGNCGAKYPD